MDARPATPATCLRPHPSARLKLRLQKKDMVRMKDDSGQEIIAIVEKFEINGKIELIPHMETNAAKRYKKDKLNNIYIRKMATSLMKAGTRRIHVDEMGRLRDTRPSD